MTVIDSISIAVDAGLRYVEPGAPGYRRVRRGRGFSYLTETGDVVNGKVRERIEELTIPPAWENVWISRDPLGHAQATGNDKAGRKQYIYHRSWEEMRDEVKFERLGRFGQRLPSLRRSVDSDLRSQGLPSKKVIALAVAVLDRTLVRVGNPEYAVRNESYGLTTLTCQHVEVDGKHVHLEFEAKGGAECQLAFEDRRIADLVAQCQELDGQTLFSYETPQGESASVTSSDVNKYLTETLDGPFTAKDFRTWGASSLVVGELARSPVDDPAVKIGEAIDVAATQLGNSSEVCRDAYIHPLVVEAGTIGAIGDVWPRARAGKWINREESALRLLLDSEQGR
ncbi:MAG TPA: DNA topoisomerase IB [Acidimicrobiia bacterium]